MKTRTTLLWPALLLGLIVTLTACEPKKPAIEPGMQAGSQPQPVAQAKPADAKPADAKPADAKPADAKPAADAKPDGAKPEILGVGATPANIEPGVTRQYGAAFTMTEEPIELAAAIAKAKESTGPYKVKATVNEVCQAKGCWFTLKAPEVPLPIRVKMKGYAFFMPKNAGDAEAVLEGTLKEVTLDQKTAQHYEDDAAAASGKPAKQVTGPVQSYMFMATAVQLKAQPKG